MKCGEIWKAKKHMVTDIADRVTDIHKDDINFPESFVKDEIKDNWRVVIESLKEDVVGFSILYTRLEGGGPDNIDYVSRKAFLYVFERDDAMNQELNPNDDL